MSRFLAGTLYITGTTVFGFVAGGLLGGRVFATGDMGYDRLASAMGGVAIGVLVGIVVGVWSVARMDNRRRSLGGVMLWVCAVLTVVLLRAGAG